MIRMDPPDLDPADVFAACISRIRDPGLKLRMKAVTHLVVAASDDFDDLAANEQFEVEVLSAYLPAQADDAEVEAVVAAAVAAAGASGPQAMGKVMAAVKAGLAGRADMTKVSAMVKARLAG